MQESLILSLKSWSTQKSQDKKQKWRQTKAKIMINCILLQKLYKPKFPLQQVSDWFQLTRILEQDGSIDLLWFLGPLTLQPNWQRPGEG